jgi:hypothetical protein
MFDFREELFMAGRAVAVEGLPRNMIRLISLRMLMGAVCFLREAQARSSRRRDEMLLNRYQCIDTGSSARHSGCLDVV